MNHQVHRVPVPPEPDHFKEVPGSISVDSPHIPSILGYVTGYVTENGGKAMASSVQPYRKLTKLGKSSYYVVLPPELVRRLGWRERQKLTVKQKGKTITRLPLICGVNGYVLSKLTENTQSSQTAVPDLHRQTPVLDREARRLWLPLRTCRPVHPPP